MDKGKKPIVKKWWFWVVIAIVIIGIASAASGGGNQANETEKSTSDTSSSESTTTTESKARLTLDDGWTIDKSNPYATTVKGYVSNNSDSAIDGYIQITFSALDGDGANVGDCLANANTVEANGKWKFEAMCSGDEIETVKFKDITGF